MGQIIPLGNPGGTTGGGSAILENVVFVTGTSQTIAPGTLYIANNAALVTFTLPASFPAGDQFAIQGMGAGGWRVAQLAGQQQRVGSSASTVGVAGTMSSANQYDSVLMTCLTANTLFSACLGPLSSGLVLA